jgi:hypothetical protein
MHFSAQMFPRSLQNASLIIMRSAGYDGDNSNFDLFAGAAI